jgi:hypothetical protein
LSEPTSELIVKLDWSSDHLSAEPNDQVTIELQHISGRTLASMSVPRDALRLEFSQTLKPCALMSLEGMILVSLEEFTYEPDAKGAIAVDQLISEAISTEMLEDEPEAAQMLSKLRDRLLKSLEHVEKALGSLPKD